jgi:hypothetical protein
MLPVVSLDKLPRPTPADEPPPRQGTVLVLNDLPATVPADVAQAIEDRCAALVAAGWQLVRESSPGDADAADHEILLQASARAAVGLSDPSDEEAVQRLGTFLRAHSSELDAVLWIGGGAEDTPPRMRIVSRVEDVGTRLSVALEAS